MIITILKYILWISFLIQIFYFLYFYLRIIVKQKKLVLSTQEKEVSVIISAKNEAENLKNFLPKILNQNYVKFEVIVINDASEDDTLKVLDEFAEENKHLKIVNIKESLGKKNALTKGIEASKYEYLLFTDADCYPVSENWIFSMMQAFDNETEIVLAYGSYKTEKGFLNKLIRFETIFIVLKYMSFAKIGRAYMGVGRNLAYKKSLFYKNKGFNSHKNILSGDDDLFINEVANKKNVACITTFESITKSIPKTTWKQFFKQKSRHLTTGVKYKLIHKILLSLDTLTSIFFYFTLCYLLFAQLYVNQIVILYLIRTSMLFTILFIFSKRMHEKNNLIFISIFEVLMLTVNTFVIIRNIFIKNNTWK